MEDTEGGRRTRSRVCMGLHVLQVCKTAISMKGHAAVVSARHTRQLCTCEALEECKSQ